MTFLLQLPGLNLLTDPLYSERASPVQWLGPRRVHSPGIAFDALPPIHAVFVSHNHYDHLDVATLLRLQDAHAPLYVTGLGNAAFLRQFGIRRVIELDWWDHAPLPSAEVTFTPAHHWSTRGPGSRNRSLWGGMWLDNGCCQVYFAGDTAFAPLFAQLRLRCGEPDVAILPIGAYEPRWFMGTQHMNPDDAVRAHLALGAHHSVAGHFGCFQLTDEGIDAPVNALAEARWAHRVSPEAFVVPVPGQTLRWQAQRPGAPANAAPVV